MLTFDRELGGNGLVPGDLRSLDNWRFREIRPVPSLPDRCFDTTNMPNACQSWASCPNEALPVAILRAVAFAARSSMIGYCSENVLWHGQLCYLSS